jgi:hypothetical protein
MLIVAVCAALVGVALGLRFNVFVLLPATMLALLCTGVVGAIVAASVASIFVAMFYVCAALQIGYSFSLLIWLGVLYLLPEHRRNSNLLDIGLQHRPALKMFNDNVDLGAESRRS